MGRKKGRRSRQRNAGNRNLPIDHRPDRTKAGATRTRSAAGGRRPAGTVAAFTDWINSRGVVTGFLVVIAVVCSGGVLLSYAETTALRERGLVAIGEVVEVHHGFGRASSSYVRVKFEDREGAAVDARVHSEKWADPQPGDQVEVLYDPLHPNDVVGAGVRPDFVATWLWGFGGLSAVAVIWPTWTGRLDWRKLNRR